MKFDVMRKTRDSAADILTEWLGRLASIGKFLSLTARVPGVNGSTQSARLQSPHWSASL